MTTDITELALSKSLRKKLNRRLNDAYGFQRTSGGKHTTISLSIDECKSIIAAMDERLALVEALEKAQQVDEELCKLLPPGAEYMDPLGGGNVTPLEGVRRMVADYRQRIAELEHPAGINAAGKQVVRHALVEIQERRKADREPVAEVVSIYGDPEAFGEREIRPLVGIQQMPYGTKLYRQAQPAPEYPEVLPCSVLLEPGLRFGKGIKTSTMLAALSRRAVYESDMAALSPEERAEFQARIEDFKTLIAQPVPVVPDAYVRDERGRMMLNGICEPKIGFGAGWNACRAAMLEAAPQLPGSESATVLGKWIPVSERMPEPGILVLVYTPPQPDDYPWDVRIGFDYIDPDGDDPTYWFNHGENYEEFYCVACDGMTGPSEKAPYTHWIPLPAAPQEVK